MLQQLKTKRLCCILFTVLTMLLCSNLIFAQCNTGNAVPQFNVDLSAASDASAQVMVSGNQGVCCTGQPNNNNCAIVNLTLNPDSEGFGISFCGGPNQCSIQLYPSVTCPVSGGQGICETVCTTGTDVSILLCKPGNFNDISLCFDAVPTPGIPDSPATSADCGASLTAVNILNPVWSSTDDPNLSYLSNCVLPGTNCGNTVNFTYTGPPITDCNGVVFEYQVDGTADSECINGPVSASGTITVYPEFTIESIDVVCTADNAVNLVPVLGGTGATCSFTYEWTDAAGNTVGTGSTLLVDPQDGQEYCLTIVRSDNTDACAIKTLCVAAEADCCEFSATCNLSPTPQIVEGCSPIDAPTPETDYNNIFTNIGASPCGTLTLISDDVVSGTLCPSGITITRTYTLFDDLAPANGVLDANEESETCVEVFTIVDTTEPFVGCPANVTQSADPKLCTAVVPDIGPTTFGDNCNGVPTVTYTLTGATTGSGVNDASGTTFNSGTTTVTYTITDACGLTTSCSFTVTIEDVTPPTFFCGKQGLGLYSIIVNTDPGQCEADVTINPPTANDNCDGLITATGVRDDGLPLTAPFPVGTTTITWTFTDSAGNTTTCSQNVIVKDTQPPTFFCGKQGLGLPNITVNTDPGQCEATVTLNPPTANDNCDGPIMATGVRGDGLPLTAPFPVGTTTITWTFTDSAGNTTTCSQNVIVKDTQPPADSCGPTGLPNINFTTTPGQCESDQTINPPVVYDNCDGAITATGIRSDGLPLNAPFPLGTTIITWTVTDAAGNTISCDQNVIVRDNQPPIVSCPNTNIVVNTTVGVCEADVTVNPPTVTDNCDGTVTITEVRSDGLPLTAPYPLGTTTITWTFTDSAGNTTSCERDVIVNDNEPPSFSNCDGQTQIFCNDETVTFDIPTATDNCDNTTVVTQTSGYESGGNFPVGTTEVCFTATDASGNSEECCFDVVVLSPITLIPSGNAFCNADAQITYQFTLSGSYPSYNGSNYTVSVSATTGNPIISPTSGSASQVFTLTLDTSTPVGTMVAINVTDEQGCSFTFRYTTTFQCCTAEAGFLEPLLQCPGEYASINIFNYQTDADYATYLILTNQNGVILDIFDVTFTGGQYGIPYDDWENLYNGTDETYNFYSYNVLIGAEPNPQPTIGSNISTIGSTQEGCFDISSNVNTFLYVPEPLIVTCEILTDNGEDGGTSPFYYNTYEICIEGGVQPYNYDWQTTGYVRHSIMGTGRIKIIYSDNAIWHVTITDDNGCPVNNGVAFTNDPDDVGGTGAILDIYDYDISFATVNSGCDDGSISIYAEGGDGNYTFTWTGPFTWEDSGYTGPGTSSHGTGTNNVSTITDLPSGWYDVTVTDGSGEVTEGWYWVGCSEDRGKGTKIAESVQHQTDLNIFPNPLVDKGLIEFKIEKESRVNIALFSINGQKVQDLFEGMVPANEITQLPITLKNALPTGLYFIHMTSDVGKQWHQKVFISK